MRYWILFILVTALCIFSIYREKRLFRNAIYLTVSAVLLILALDATGNILLDTFALCVVYIVAPLCLLFISFVFIAEGIISIKREGFSIAHSLSILFGIGIWVTFLVLWIFLEKQNQRIIVSCLLILILMLAGYIIGTFMSLLIYSLLYMLLPQNKNCDYIIILGAGLLQGERVSPLLAGRLDKAIQVYRRTGEKAKFVVSGGQGSDENISEAKAMKDYLLKQGLRGEHIMMEDKSTTTMENLVFTKRILDSMGQDYRAVFVTNDYHVFRAGTYARRAGLKADGIGCKTAFYYWPNGFIREYIAIIIHYKIVPIILLLLWILLSVISII